MATCEKVQTNEYLLRLSEEEAKTVFSLTGRVMGDSVRTPRKYSHAVWRALKERFPDECPTSQAWQYYTEGPNLVFPNSLPTPEPPPVMLADIEPGEWFRLADGNWPCVKNKREDYAYFMNDIGLGTNRGPVVRLTSAKARELAEKHGYLFPFA